MQRPRSAPRLRRPVPAWLRNALPEPVPEVSPAPASSFQPSSPVGTGLYGVDNTGQTWQYVPPGVIPLTSADGGPFLPLSGGTMQGPLNWASTGTPTARSAQDRTAEVIDVKDFGATGNGTTPDDAAIQAALNAVPVNGATVRLPTGTYLMRNTLLVKSNTRIVAASGATLLADTSWTGSEVCFIENASHNYPTHVTPPVVQVDHDIAIEGLTFDHGTFVNVVTSAKHSIFFTFVNNVLIRDCTFYGRNTATSPPASPAADACAMPGCANVRIEACRAYDFHNCFYDFWIGATDIAVVGCYAAANSEIAQMINFNPDTDGADPNLVCDGFQLIGNTLICTVQGPGVVLVAPLNPNCTSQNITIADNIFDDVYVNYRGDTRAITITGNVTRNLQSAPAFDGYPNLGGTPAGVSIVGNAIENPATSASNGGVIRCNTDDAVITGNVITGTAYGTAPGIYTSTFAPQVFGNYISNGIISSPGGLIISTPTGLQFQTWLTVGFNAGNLTPPGGNSGSFSWNASGGGAEVDYWNDFTTPDVSHTFWQRTGAGTQTRLLDIGPTGALEVYGANISVGAPGAATVTAGTTIPTAVMPAGSIYLHTGGASGQRLYVSNGDGTWNAVAGV